MSSKFEYHSSAVQNQKAVSAYFRNEQRLPFGFADWNYVFLPDKYTWPSSHQGMYSHIHCLWDVNCWRNSHLKDNEYELIF